MTPFHIELMLHIYSIAEPIDGLHDPEGPQRAAINEFLHEKLIVPGKRAAGYELTDRGEAYIRFLISMPLPVANWEIPGPWSPSTPSKGQP